MKKNRILSLILSVIMLFTIGFPVGVFAEEIETRENELEVGEIVVEFSTEDAPDEEFEIEVVPTPDEEYEIEVVPAPDEEYEIEVVPAPDEDEGSFTQGYVCVNNGTIVYASESKQEEKGSFSGHAVVYAVVSSRTEDKAYSWLQITFDTAEAKEANDALLNGYIQFKDVSVLSDEAVEQLVDYLKYDKSVRSYGEKLLPAVCFNAVEIETIGESADEEVVTASGADKDTVLPEVEEGRVISRAISATGNSSIRIIKGPEDVTAAVGTTISFTVEAEGEGLTYQWQFSKNGTNWTNTTMTGYNTTTLPLSVIEGRYAYLWRCVVTDAYGNKAESDGAKIIRPLIINDVTYESLTPATCAVVSYSGTSSSLTIPETVEGMTVIEIGVEAFMDNKQLVSIDLPDTITVIRARAFKGCTSLSDMH